MTDTSMITLWHQRARPQPTERDFDIQVGVHLEEVVEMLNALDGNDAESRNKINTVAYVMSGLAEGLKAGTYSAYALNRKEVLDSLCDQIVTSIGVAHCAGMNIGKGLDIVNSSNWSKFDEQGQPIFDANGKVKKGSRYTPPHLDECV